MPRRRCSLAPLSLWSSNSDQLDFTQVRRSDVDGDGAKPARLQRDAPGAYGRLGESGPRLLAIPGEKLVEPQVVNATGNRRRDAIQHQALQPLPMCTLRNNNQISHLGPLMGIIGSHV